MAASSPALDMIRKVWGAYQQQQATSEDVLGVLGQVAGFVQFELGNLAAQAESGQSNPQDPVFRSIMQAFQLHLEAVELMAGEFDSPESPGQLFQRGLGLAEQATAQLIQAHQRTMEHIQAMATVSCMFCGAENPRGTARCQKCGRGLPAASGEAESTFSAVQAEGLEYEQIDPNELSENYVMVLQALEAWRREEIDPVELFEILREVERRTLAHREENRKHAQMVAQAPPEAQEELAEAVRMTEAALLECLNALKTMQMAFEKQDDTYLENGLVEMEQGSRALVQAFHASRAAAALIGSSPEPHTEEP